jgi:hypothetical protein
MRFVSRVSIAVAGLALLAVLAAAPAGANRVKLLGYMFTAVGGAIGGGVASEAGKDLYDGSKKLMTGRSNLPPLPKHKVYDISDSHWRKFTTARHCIELTPRNCTPCVLYDNACFPRRETPIRFTASDLR